MRFLVDDQLPLALARWITTRGCPAEHVCEIGLTGKPDREIWAFAKSNGATIISKDEDFVYLKQLDADGPQVVWLRLGNTRNATPFQRLDPIWDHVVEKLEAGEGLLEIAR